MIFHDRNPLTLSFFSVKTKILQNQFTTFIKNINEKRAISTYRKKIQLNHSNSAKDSYHPIFQFRHLP